MDSKAQQLVELNNQWNIVANEGFSPNISSYSVKIGEDTIVDNKLYNKIYYSNDSLNTYWNFENNYLREDSTKKVFYKNGSSSEIVLYDFNLEINDTFYISEFCVQIVNEIDTIELNNGELRKRIKLGILDNPNWGQEYWIEGIGSNFGLISHFALCVTDNAEGLLCFYSNDELLYPEAPISCFVTGNEELIIDNIKIYPNPIKNYVIIEDQKSILINYFLSDSMGRIIISGDLINIKNRIEIGDLQNGYYNLILNTRDGDSYSTKIIKM